jgi:hypothetical protein
MPSGVSVNPWSVARALAVQTPESRNRFVDFLRAISICVVVFGHWLMSLPAVVDGVPQNAEVLRVLPWTQWLTWAFQVMPVFFVVGGYSNSISWVSAKRRGQTYSYWATARLNRLVRPLVPLLVFWVLFAVILRQLGVEHEMMRNASRTALIPVWFLAVYILVTVVTPITHKFYRQFGMVSFWLFGLAAAATDLSAYALEMPELRWANYGFVWLAVHQLGFLWQDGKLTSSWRTLLLALSALGLLMFLINILNYPFSMLTVPGEASSNSRPPSLALLALGVFHTGLLVFLETPARRWLKRVAPWTLTVLVNSRIMTIYLWHLTVMVLLVAIEMKFSTNSLSKLPGADGWWFIRLLWLCGLFIVLQIFVAFLGHFEQSPKPVESARYSAWRVVIGTILLSLGLALLVTGGISDEGGLGLRLSAVLPTFVGIMLVLPGTLLSRMSR